MGLILSKHCPLPPLPRSGEGHQNAATLTPSAVRADEADQNGTSNHRSADPSPLEVIDAL